jgi:hypothetical protein
VLIFVGRLSERQMTRNTQKRLTAYALILFGAFIFRAGLATMLANDELEDSEVYEQIARNLIQHHVYSNAAEPPYESILVRSPGYPIFLAAIYSVFGDNNNTAVRVIQAIVDTTACALIALLASLWEPVTALKRKSSIVALILASVCPFTAIYVGTILSETLATFCAIATVVIATLAFKSTTQGKRILLWLATGLLAGVAMLVRPDAGLFAAAIATALVVSNLMWPGGANVSTERHGLLPAFARASYFVSIFSLSCCFALVPWTIRNWRVFHVFQPFAPAHQEMLGEFVPRGYYAWVKTWIGDGRYIGTALWALDQGAIKIEDFPESAFDSAEEKQRVATLLFKYNHPTNEFDETFEPERNDEQPLRDNEKKNEQVNDDASGLAGSEAEDSEEDTTEEGQDLIRQQRIEQPVQMTRPIDSAFGQIASERIKRRPFHYYVVLPVRRALSLWFDTHSQHYPFEGSLLPFSNLDVNTNQHFWLPLFAVLTFVYSLLGTLGGWMLWQTRNFAARQWVILVGLIVLLRLAFFATLENPEPRYVVELFPLVAALGGIGWTHYRAERTRQLND